MHVAWKALAGYLLHGVRMGMGVHSGGQPGRGESLRMARAELSIRRAMRAGFFECDMTVAVGRPSNKADILGMIRRYDRVKAVGIGHRCVLQAGRRTHGTSCGKAECTRACVLLKRSIYIMHIHIPHTQGHPHASWALVVHWSLPKVQKFINVLVSHTLVALWYQHQRGKPCQPTKKAGTLK